MWWVQTKCGGMRISIGLGSCWIGEEKWNLEVWKSSGVKREVGSAMLCGHWLWEWCSIDKQGRWLCIICDGDTEVCYWFLSIHFCFMGSHPVRAALWHWMLTKGLTWGGNWWLPGTWSLPGWTHKPFTSIVARIWRVFALTSCPAWLQHWGLFASSTVDGEILQGCWNSKLEELYGNDAITFSYSLKASLCKSLSGRHRIE